MHESIKDLANDNETMKKVFTIPISTLFLFEKIFFTRNKYFTMQ